MKKVILLISTLLAFTCLSDARTVKGTVHCDGASLKDVIVTDGEHFAKTNSKGRFRLEVDKDADFVHIVTPAGYVADWSDGTPRFYIDANADNFDFELQKYDTSSDWALVAMADPQAQHERHFAKFVKRNVELKAWVADLKETPVGIALGDIGWDSMYLYPEFKKEFRNLGFPVYPVIGNHDHNKDLKGDHETAADYRASFGPENYAFCLGQDYVIVLDNILYDTQKKYVESYTESQIEWVKDLLKYIPETATIYIAQHSPLYYWFNSEKERYVGLGKELLEVLDDRTVNFLSGHTHINNNIAISDNVREHNVAAYCGTWWITDHCNDGTPGGYKIFENVDGELSWYYKSFGHDKDFQCEFFNIGEVKALPNAIVANVWDYDEEWSVTWLQDGKDMGAMEQVTITSPYYEREIKAAYTDRGKNIPNYKKPHKNIHYFAAVPSQYAKVVTVIVKDRFGHQWRHDYDMSADYIDVQAHRGGAGLMPENTFSSMKNALDLGVNTLEFDLQISKDGEVVVSHDPYFHSRYSTRPDGSLVKKTDPKTYLYQLNYDEIKKWDVGTRDNLTWPGQANIPEVKPLLKELIPFIETYTKDHNMTPVRYNIEVKSKNNSGEGTQFPEYHEFVDKCIALLESFDLGDRLVVQCFDVRALEYMHEKYPELYLSYLVGSDESDFDVLMSKLSFTPHWLSPHHSIVDKAFLKATHDRGMKLVPWTVDKPEDIARMVKIHVDAIISNYPDRVLEVTRQYK